MVIIDPEVKLCITCDHILGVKRKKLSNGKISCESLTNSHKFICKNKSSKSNGLSVIINNNCHCWEKFQD